MDIASATDAPLENGDSCPAPQALEEDARLVELVRGGDMAAFSSLVEKYRARLYSVMYNMTANREDAADLTQEVFVKAFRNLARFRGGSKFYTWLYRIGVNAAVSHIKRNRFRRFFSFERLDPEASDDEALSLMVADHKSETRAALGYELREKLNEALQKLSNKHRTVVVLFELEGLSHAEIASVLDCSEGTVRSRLHYAKQQLQAYLRPYLRS